MAKTGAPPMVAGRPWSTMPLFGLLNGLRRGLMAGDAVDSSSGEPRSAATSMTLGFPASTSSADGLILRGRGCRRFNKFEN